MPYPSDFEVKLGFDSIREKIHAACLSSLGQTLVEGMKFQTDLTTLRTQLRQVFEFKQVFDRGEEFPSSHYFDPTGLFLRIAIEGDYLEESDFLAIAYSQDTIWKCRTFLTKWKEDFPELYKLSLPVPDLRKVTSKILATIDDDARVKDSASPELSRIRKKIREAESTIRRVIDHSYRQAIGQGWVPENSIPSIRDGRLAIPIFAEHKRKMKGLIVDESATGQTVYMEPLEALEVNNELRDLGHSESREVIRILKALTDLLRQDLPLLSISYEFLASIDFIRAKARFAVEVGATLPSLSGEPLINWRNARHPLLFLSLKGKREIVPLNISLTNADRMLLVSGPNAGGKSVCLKTVGLVQYMFQCGCLVPLDEDSEVGVFNDILVDIGDQQSIENDLSTYSSHLKNMVYFIRSTDQGSLVLLDELGSGTDPNFGGAIAQAVLDALVQKQVWGVATTHYYNLKLYAGQTQGIRNAAMRFDDKQLRPLYQLEIGKPGSSFALEIATNTGLPRETLNYAKSLVGAELLGFEKLTSKLEQERNELESQIIELKRKESKLDDNLKKYEKLTNDLEIRKKEIIEKAKQEAALLLKDTNKEIEKTIRHIRENQAQKKETLRVRKNLGELSKKVVAEKQKEQSVTSFSKGDNVRIIGQQGSGVILSVKGKNAIVQFGELKSQVAVSRLESASSEKPVELSRRLRSVGLDVREKQSNFNSTLDVRGKRVEEVTSILDQFIDDATLLGYSELKIIHGKGEGVLRKVVREQLRRYKAVESATDEHIERGGDGITVVVLK